MLYPSGENKAFMIDYNQIAELPEDDEICVKLTSQQIWALFVQCKYIGWRTRWMNHPPEFDISAFKAELENRLMCDCECFDCDDVADCIATSTPVQDVLDTHIKNYLANNGWGNSPGKPISVTAANDNLAGLTNEFCNLDILWAQCLFLVQTTNSLIEDLLQKFETLTNPLEVAEGTAEVIPLVGDLIAAAPQYINLAQNFITENYYADYTTTPITGYEDVLACQLFCACQGDCQVTINRMFDILLQRVITRFESSPALLNTISDLTSWLVGIDVAGEFVADMAFLVVWGGVKLANFVIGGLTGRPKIGDGILRMYLELAADDPSADWMTICAECPSYENIVIEANPYPATPDYLTLDADGGTFTGGDNRVVNAPYQAEINLPDERRVHTVSVIMAQSHESDSVVIIGGISYNLIRGAYHGGTTYTYTAEIPDVLTNQLNLQFATEAPFTFIILSGVDSFVIEVWQV
jgi:hypothetical protein